MEATRYATLMKLREVASRLGCELRGDGDIEIARVAPIESAGPGDLTFVANPRYARFLHTTRASAVIVASTIPDVSIATVRAKDPQLAFALAIELFHVPIVPPLGIHPTAVIAPTATIGANASIDAYAVIGADVRIGHDARIAAHVVIYPQVAIGDRFTAHAHVAVREQVRIGNDVTLHCGVVIGSDGFGYTQDTDGSVRKIVQGGTVVLEDGVEIGANTTVDRAAVGATFVRRGAKLDNLVMVAHGCDVGEGAMLAGQVGLAGSTKIGRFVRMGGQAGASGHLAVGDGAQIGAQAGVIASVDAGAVVSGTPAIGIATWRRMVAVLPRLPELLRRLRVLEKHAGEADDPDDLA